MILSAKQKFEISFEFEEEVEINDGAIMRVLMRGWEGMGGCQLIRKIEVKNITLASYPLK